MRGCTYQNVNGRACRVASKVLVGDASPTPHRPSLVPHPMFCYSIGIKSDHHRATMKYSVHQFGIDRFPFILKNGVPMIEGMTLLSSLSADFLRQPLLSGPEVHAALFCVDTFILYGYKQCYMYLIFNLQCYMYLYQPPYLKVLLNDKYAKKKSVRSKSPTERSLCAGPYTVKYSRQRSRNPDSFYEFAAYRDVFNP
jgi:hypothetical protein